MPYPPEGCGQMVIYLYSGQLDCEEMSLRALMDLLDIFNMANLNVEYGSWRSTLWTSSRVGRSLTLCQIL